ELRDAAGTAAGPAVDRRFPHEPAAAAALEMELGRLHGSARPVGGEPVLFGFPRRRHLLQEQRPEGFRLVVRSRRAGDDEPPLARRASPAGNPQPLEDLVAEEGVGPPAEAAHFDERREARPVAHSSLFSRSSRAARSSGLTPSARARRASSRAPGRLPSTRRSWARAT